MYNEALSRSPNNSSAYTNLGNAHFKLGRRDEARRAWQKAIELDPANEKAQRSLKSIND
jgi:Flp pilus assembly protein TadD